jgi:hypothetical protein
MTYDFETHLAIERNRYRLKNARYLLRKYRRLRKLRGSGIPVDLPLTGGEAVTKLEEGKATNRAVVIGDAWRD